MHNYNYIYIYICQSLNGQSRSLYVHTHQPEGLEAVSQLQIGVQIKYAHIPSDIHSGYFYSASSSSLGLLLGGAPDYSFDTVSELIHGSAKGNASEGVTQGPYCAAKVRF